MNLIGCCSRRLGPSRSATELEATLEASLDPDNIPPRSRLFLVVPKNADGAAIEVRSSKCSYQRSFACSTAVNTGCDAAASVRCAIAVY